MDPHSFSKLVPDPYSPKKLDPHSPKKLDPDPHKFKTLQATEKVLTEFKQLQKVPPQTSQLLWLQI
jgi:hypothetical protein